MANLETIDPDLTSGFAQRYDGPGLFRLVTHLAALGVTGGLIAHLDGQSWQWAAMVLHGAVLIFLFPPLHECVHGTAFASAFLNTWVSRFCGLTIILTPGYFSAFHFAHHRHTQDPDLDPELATPKPKGWGSYFWILSGAEYWWRMVWGLLRRAAGLVGDRFVTKSRVAGVVLEARIYLLIYAGLIAGSVWLKSDVLLTYWVIPALLGQPFLRIFLLAEHWGCPSEGDMWARTRSTLSNPIVHWFAWNMPHHAEHHAYPTVPFHALPGLAAHMAAKREVVSPGYVPFHGGEVSGLIRGGRGV